MLRGVTLLAGAGLLTGCAFSVPKGAMPVEEVVADLERLNGHEVTIVGWMGDWCGGLDCRVFRSPEDARVLDTWDHDKHEIDDRWQAAYDNSINFCWDETKASLISAFMLKKRVVATGTLDADCKINGGCFDGCDFKLKSVARLDS